MTDKERLENMVALGVDGQGNVLIKVEDFHWLMEQAERAQELESELNKQIEIGYKFEGEVYDLAKENKRYREALKNIYELAEYDEYDNTLEQIVSEVEKALEG